MSELDLVKPHNTVAVLQKYQFHFQKKYGQNFLIDPHVLNKIISAANISEDDFVLEIGPGIGTLTQYLCKYARAVAAIEIDQNLIPILQDTLSECKNVMILHGDILKVDVKKLAEEHSNGKEIKVIANLPYYITTPVIMRLFESNARIERIVVMVQKEVADRMQAQPGTKDYGALSLAVQYYAKPKITAFVPPNCFMPRPKVGSAVIRLDCNQKHFISVKDEAFLFRVIRASFHQRRKTLVNGLSNAPDFPLTKQQICEGIGQAGLPLKIRGEELTLAQFAQLADILFALAVKVDCYTHER